nr:unnamed protein product [Callosobruchus analis]
MFKFLVLSALIAVVYGAPKPGYLHGGIGYGYPAATSYASRIDVHTPVIKAYSTPIISTPVHYGYGIGHGYGLGHGYGSLGHGYSSLGHGYGLGHSGYSLGHGYSGYGGYGHGYGSYGHGW